MSSSAVPPRQQLDDRHASIPFRPSPSAAAVLASLALMSAGPLYAAEPTVEELQTEILRLKQALEKSQQELAARKDVPAASPAAVSAPGSAQPVAQTAAAEEPQTLDAVVVRSRNRIERLQDVPLSISVVSGKELDRLGTTDIGAITKRVGNVNWNYGNQRTFALSLRGIGKQGQTEAQDPAVGLLVDGVAYSYNALASSFDFTDIDTIEVARGPQGTLLGKNASIGAVTVTTKKPSFTPSADYSITYGKFDTVKAQYAGGGPVVDNVLAWRGSFSASKANGDLVNTYNRDLTFTNTDRLTGRVQFLVTPSADFTARFSFDATPRAGEFTNARTIYLPTPRTYADGAVNPLTNDASTKLARRWFTQVGSYSYANNWLYGGADGKSVDNDAARPLSTGSHGAAADLSWNLGSHTLTSITAYKDYHFNAVNDEGTPFDIQRNSGGFWNDYKQLTQELRLASQTGGFVDYQTGVYLAHITNFNDYRKVFGNDAGAWFATASQYNTLDANGQGRYLMANSLANLSLDYNSPSGIQNIDNRSQAVFGQANWHLSDATTLTTGVRFTHEDRRNTASSQIRDNGSAAELNPSVVNGVALGGFDSYSNTGAGAVSVLNGNVVAAGTPGAVVVAPGAVGLTTDTTSAAGVAQANAQADIAAQKYFGVANWGALTLAQQKQIAAAQAIRKTQIGVLFNSAQAQPYNKTLPAYVISPSFKINDNLTTYASLQHGEKAGVAQFTNGISNPVKEEKTTSLEVGFKSALLDRTLIFNTALYVMDVKNYQQTTQIFDTYTTALKNDGNAYYTTATGNVPKVRSKGLELDGIYGGIRNTTLRFAGAYTDARYVTFPNSSQPAENGDIATATPYRDVSGKTLPGAAKWTYNIGADYRHPFAGDKEFHTSVNVAYTSRWNSDVYLSDYAWIKANYVTDFAAGIGAVNRSYDFSFLVKNLFNDKTPLSQTWSSGSSGSYSYTPANPRWIGVMFTGKL